MIIQDPLDLGAEVQFTDLATLHPLHLIHRCLHPLKDRAGLGLQQCTGFGQLYPPMAAHEQLRAQQLLQLTDLLAQWRL